MKQAIEEAIRLFGGPDCWTAAVATDLPGAERPQVFVAAAAATGAELAAMAHERRICNIAVIGVNPVGLSVAFTLRQQGRRVTLLPDGGETAAVAAVLAQPATAEFFGRHGIVLHPGKATALRGSQVHCQSGYCGFICEGRFIEESEEVGRVLTADGTVYADMVVLAAMAA